MKKIIYEGFQQGLLTIETIEKRRVYGKSIIFLKCICRCGKNKEIKKSNFIKGQQSCGCLRNKLAGNRTRTHGLSGDRQFIDAFYSPLKRIKTIPKYKYIKYKLGTIQDFIDNMYEGYLEHCEKYGKENTSLDRRGNKGDYEYGNIRWATRVTQNNNQNKRDDQKKFVLNYEGKEYFFYNKSECARQFSFNLTTMTDWLNHGNKPRNKKVLYIKYV